MTIDREIFCPPTELKILAIKRIGHQAFDLTDVRQQRKGDAPPQFMEKKRRKRLLMLKLLAMNKVFKDLG